MLCERKKAAESTEERKESRETNNATRKKIYIFINRKRMINNGSMRTNSLEAVAVRLKP
jgi:hypothetical protein